jgi:hypothetical protein
MALAIARWMGGDDNFLSLRFACGDSNIGCNGTWETFRLRGMVTSFGGYGYGITASVWFESVLWTLLEFTAVTT